MFDLSISIVLYKNKEKQIQNLLDCFYSTTLSHKIYLVDNSPTDELKIIATGNNVEYIFNDKNLGYGAAHNIALKRTIDKSLYHLVLNPDIKFEGSVLAEVFRFMESNNEIGHVLPKVLYPDGSLQYVCKLIPTPLNLFSRLLPGSLFKKYNEKFELRFSGYNEIMNIPYLSGCFMFLRCSALKEIGLFDERFFMYPEDIDLTRRMHKKYRTVFYPHIEIFHEHTKSSFKSLHMFTIHMYNIFKYFNKWGWLFDRERKNVNKAVLEQLKYNNK